MEWRHSGDATTAALDNSVNSREGDTERCWKSAESVRKIQFILVLTCWGNNEYVTATLI